LKQRQQQQPNNDNNNGNSNNQPATATASASGVRRPGGNNSSYNEHWLVAKVNGNNSQQHRALKKPGGNTPKARDGIKEQQQPRRQQLASGFCHHPTLLQAMG
jgi:hypothetical protein